MSDIEILFGSNAPEVTREIVNAERATIAAAKAAAQLDKAVASEARTLKTAAQAAREYAKELRSSQNALTGAPGASRGNHPLASVLSGNGAQIKTNIQRALASSNRDIRASMEKAGEESGGRFSAGLRGAIERNLAKYGGLGRSPVAKMLGGVGENGNATGAGQAAAATLAISAAWLAVSKTIEIATAALDGHLDRLKRVQDGQLESLRLTRAAAEANRAAGVAAAQEHGAGILAVSANGGQAALDKVRAAARAAGTNENDAAAAYSTLYSRFGGDQAKIAQGLDIGADVAKVTGKGLSDTVATLGQQELGNVNRARDRLTALGLGHITVQPGDYSAAAGRINGTPDAVRVQSILGTLAGGDTGKDKRLADGIQGAGEVAARETNPGQVMIAEHIRALRENAEALANIDNNTQGWARVFDRLLHPTNTVRRQAMAAEDELNLVSGAQPVQ